MSKTAQEYVKMDILESFEYLHRNGYDGLDIAVGTIEALREFVLECNGKAKFDDAIYPLTEILRAPLTA
jgi:hypothetical protein